MYVYSLTSEENIMKLFKDVVVGESFVLHNGQQLIRISPLQVGTELQPVNATDLYDSTKRFCIGPSVQCLTVDELMAISE